MTPLEKDMERALVGAVKRRGGMALKWVCPGWAGVPDRIVLLPGGRVLFAELKRPKGGEVRKLQEWWHGRLRRLGFTVWVIRDRGDIAALESAIGQRNDGGGEACNSRHTPISRRASTGSSATPPALCSGGWGRARR